MLNPNLNANEHHILNHVSMWGSDGYGAYVVKVGRGWHVVSCPKIFPTKRAATAQFEAYLAILRDRLAGRIESYNDETHRRAFG